MPAEVLIRGKVSRSLPPPSVEQARDGDVERIGRYQEGYKLIALTPPQVSSDEGTNFVTTNPIPGTKVDYGSAGTQTAFSDTVPFMLFKNDYSLSDPKARRMVFDYLRILQIGGTAPATTTSVQAAFKIDNINRQNSAGTLSSLVPVNVNIDDSTPSRCLVFAPAGAVATIPASSAAARLVGRAQLKGGPTLVLDEYNIQFGPQDTPTQGGYLTTVASYVSTFPAVILGPQQWGVLYLWLPGGATNPFSFEFEFRHRER